ncbi:MAG: helix-turn-helix domain-containing protein [Pseudomonadota bacterium]
MSIAARLRKVRGGISRKEFGIKLGVHPNTVGNYEGEREPPVCYIAAVAKSNGIRLEWLIHGTGAMREGEEEPTYFQEKIAYCVSLAIDAHYGDKLKETPLQARAIVLRAVSKYLFGMGVTDENVPDRQSLIGLVKLTGGLLGIEAPNVATSKGIKSIGLKN